MDSVSALIDKLGGPAAVAEALGAKVGTIRQIRLRDRVVVEHWDALIALAAERNVPGVTHEFLTKLALRPKRGA